ncbi:TBC1 domain family member 2B-like isoform X2 [Petromyzon marinus]|nr:TBC1 domain family member 2B-like isoform X2 [Petromyzon marinus]
MNAASELSPPTAAAGGGGDCKCSHEGRADEAGRDRAGGRSDGAGRGYGAGGAQTGERGCEVGGGGRGAASGGGGLSGRHGEVDGGDRILESGGAQGGSPIAVSGGESGDAQAGGGGTGEGNGGPSHSHSSSSSNINSIGGRRRNSAREGDMDLDDEDEDDLELEGFEELSLSELPAAGSDAGLLCGYLNKVAGKGPLRAAKTRWFALEASSCSLLYYRDPKQVRPLGRISVAHASFSYDVDGEPGRFEIRTPERRCVLEAADQQTMLYWLQELQKKRCEHSLGIGTASAADTLSAGLVARSAQAEEAGGASEGPHTEPLPPILPPLPEPTGLVGQLAAILPAPMQPTALSNYSLKHLGTEIRNSMSQLRVGRGGRENRRSQLYQEAADTDIVDTVALPREQDSTGPNPQAYPEPAPRQRMSLGGFRNKLGMKRRPLSRALNDTENLGVPVDTSDADLEMEVSRLRQELDTQKEVVRLLQQSLHSVHQEQRRRERESSTLQRNILQQAQQRVQKLSSRVETVYARPGSSEQADASASPGDGGGRAASTSDVPVTLLIDFAVPVSPKAEEGGNQACDKSDAQHRASVGFVEREVGESLTEEGGGGSLRQEVAALKKKVEELQEIVRTYSVVIQVKDETIVHLTRRLGEKELREGMATATLSGMRNQGIHVQQEEMQKLEDDILAYKTQNKFLNKEIMELGQLWKRAEDREAALQEKMCMQEARCCQLESRYLVLLQEASGPLRSGTSEDSHSQEMVSRLLEEAMMADVYTPDGTEHQQQQLIARPILTSEYDQYGFRTEPDGLGEEERLAAKALALDRRSLSIIETRLDASLRVKWENMLAASREPSRSPELKMLMRSGVPHELRSRVWRWAVEQHVRAIRGRHAASYYCELLERSHGQHNPAARQVELDLPRTLPNNRHFETQSSEGIVKLRRVLLAYAWHNPEVGYCQGLNRLAAIALIYLEEEQAFWCLVAIVECLMPPDYYSKTLLASQVDQRLFKELVTEKLPRLAAHFEQHGVDVSLITFNWFLVLFVDSVGSDMVFRIWDAFLYEGTKVIFRYALAMLKCREEQLIKHHSNSAIFNYLRIFTHSIHDYRQLATIAFVDMNPFPMRYINQKRVQHRDRVRAELSELERVRLEFVRHRQNIGVEEKSFLSEEEEDS